HSQFNASVADIVLGENVTNTKIIGGSRIGHPGTVLGGGLGTSIQQDPEAHGSQRYELIG
ncbi:MAG TPA: hypothetical protein VFV34_15205, partial [Blastocatellia bacterium]|nr:hypothetical protein [Blastocatellia bacterium]